jgi:hypothetical protein
MDNNDIGRVVGGAFIALCNGLSPEGVEIACDTLRGFAENTDFNPEVRRIFECIASTGDNAEDEIEHSRPHLQVVGGNSAA